MRIDGHCHCGALAWEAEIDPGGVYVCHCTDCQAISGGAGRWAVTVAAEDFRLLSGTPATYVKDTADSGRESHQQFCGVCAAPLHSSTPADGHALLRLRLGTCRQRDRLPPRIELWCRSAQGWARLPGAAESREGQ